MFRKTGKLCTLVIISMLFVAPVAHAEEADGARGLVLEILSELVDGVLDTLAGGEAESNSGDSGGEGGDCGGGDEDGGYGGSIEPIG